MPTSSRRASSSRTEAGTSRRATRLAALAIAAAAAGLLASTPVLAEDAAAGAPDAAKLWTKNCQSCHGPDGKGKTKAGEKAGVKDLSSAEVKGELTREKALKSMTDGIKAKDSDKLVMKSYKEKLSQAEMEALADHSLTFK